MSATPATSVSSESRTKRSSSRTSSAARKKATTARATKAATKKTTATKKAATKRTSQAKKTTTTRARSAISQTKAEPTPRTKNDERHEDSVEDNPGEMQRKAPTTLPQTKSLYNFRPPVSMVVVGVLSFGLFLSGAIVGYSDPGEIDVQFILEQRAYELAVERGETTAATAVPVQNSATRTERPRLRPSVGADAARPETPTTATTTATSSDAIATSTVADTETATTTVDGDSESVDSDDSSEEVEEIEVSD